MDLAFFCGEHQGDHSDGPGLLEKKVVKNDGNDSNGLRHSPWLRVRDAACSFALT